MRVDEGRTDWSLNRSGPLGYSPGQRRRRIVGFQKRDGRVRGQGRVQVGLVPDIIRRVC